MDEKIKEGNEDELEARVEEMKRTVSQIRDFNNVERSKSSNFVLGESSQNTSVDFG